MYYIREKYYAVELFSSVQFNDMMSNCYAARKNDPAARVCYICKASLIKKKSQLYSARDQSAARVYIENIISGYYMCVQSRVPN